MKEKKVYFKNKKGHALCGVLTLPEDKSRKYNLVILCHGFTSSKDSSTYPFIAEKLYERGILSLRFDFFGHGESEGKFEDITITEGAEDILSAVDFAESLEYAKSIALFGTSFGGVSAVFAASRTDKISALGLKCPAVEMAVLYRNGMGEEAFRSWKERGFVRHHSHDGKEFSLNFSFYEDGASLDAYGAAGQISVPVLVVHGTEDSSVPPDNSRKLSEALGTAELRLIEGADHHFDRPQEKEKINMMFVKFFKEVLA